MADYKQNPLFIDVVVSINFGPLTLSRMEELKFLAFTAKIPQTATFTIVDGVVTFKYRVPKKEPSNLPYPDGKQNGRNYIAEF